MARLKVFKDDKRYVFRADLVQSKGKYLIAWWTQVDGQEVQVKGKRVGFVGEYAVIPEWCELL